MRLKGASRSLEQAVSVVRVLLAVLCAILIASVGAARPNESAARSLILAASAVIIAVVISGVAWRLTAGPALESTWRAIGIQAADTLYFAGLVRALADLAHGSAWVLLVVPIVIASIRLDKLGVLATWLVGSVGYSVGLRVDGPQFEIGLQALVERIGLLLAVAASIAVLTRWLQEGWYVQAKLTAEGERHVHRLRVTEVTARAMRQVDATEVIKVALAHAPMLGFDATTVVHAGGTVEVAGRGDIVPSDAVVTPPADGGVEVTRWWGADGTTVHSASALETLSNDLVVVWSAEPIDDGAARAFGDLVTTATQALEAAQHLARAKFEASHDPLTGLANRGEIERLLHAACSSGDASALVFVDVDHFKMVNDTYGHLVGDRLLQGIADRISRVCKDHCVPARYGGDEFAVLVADRAAPRAPDLAAMLRTRLAQPHIIDGVHIVSTASIGVAVADTPADQRELVEQADAAAYEAKQAGRNCVRVRRLRPVELVP